MAYSDPTPESLHSMLNSYNVDPLKKITAYLFKVLKDSNIKPKGLEIPSSAAALPKRKAEIVEWSLKCIKDKAILQYLYEHMDDIEKAALQEVVNGYGLVHWDLFKAKYGDTPRVHIDPPYRWSSRDQKKEPYKFPPLSLFINTYGLMPPDMLKLIKDFIPKPKEARAESIDSLPETILLKKRWDKDYEAPLVQHLTEQTAMSELGAVLRLADNGNISVSAKTGIITKAGVNNILKALAGGDFYPDIQEEDKYDVQIGNAGIRPFAWPMLLQASGLVKLNGSKLELSRTGKTALKKPAHETLKSIWERWLKYKKFHEMNRIDIIKGQKSRGNPLYTADSSRSKLSDALYELAQGSWIQTEDFFTFLTAKGHKFDVVRNDWKLYISEPHYGSLGYNHVTWNHINGRFARAFLLEYAATLGLIDVALVLPWDAVTDHTDLWGADDLSCLSRYDGLYALRLNALGAWILGQTEEYKPEFIEEPCFSIMPNLEISLLTECLAPDKMYLEQFCDKISEKSWQIKLPKLLIAVEQGIDIKSIVTFLEERSKGPFPKKVDKFFKDAVNQAKKVQDAGEARLIKCADKTVAKQIYEQLKLRKLCMRAGDNYLAVPKAKEAVFKKELRKLGYVLGN